MYESRVTFRFRPIVTAAAFAVFVGSTAVAQEADQARFEQIAKEAAERYRVAITADAGPSVILPAQTGEVTRSLTLDDAVSLALEKNLDIAVERLNPQTFDLSIAAARASYRSAPPSDRTTRWRCRRAS